MNPAKESATDAGFSIRTVGVGEPAFEKVINLWGAERKTLGLFPAGAFEARAIAGHLLAAVTDEGTVLGYLAYRVQRRLNSAVIIHLCVDRRFRGKGVSDALWAELKNEGQRNGWESIRLKCRRDYNAKRLWERLSMVARADVDGRKEAGSELTIWVFRFARKGLLESPDQAEDDTRLRVVLDANVFFDLRGHHSKSSDESLVLTEPWMEQAVMLCVVDEIHNEVDRRHDRADRDFYHQEAQKFVELDADPAEFEKAHASVIAILGPGKSDSSRSDRKQLAKAAAARADVFVTRDEGILAAGDEIEKQLLLQVMAPGELSSRLDEVERAHLYQPLRFAGTQLVQRSVIADDIEGLVKAFLDSPNGETRNHLAHLIRDGLSKVRSADATELLVVWDHDGTPVGFVMRAIIHADCTTIIPCLRVRGGPLESTLVRHLLLAQVQRNCEAGLARIRVTDKYLGAATIEALRELSFLWNGVAFERLTPSVIANHGNVVDLLTRLSAPNPAQADATAASYRSLSPSAIEERFWPAKVTGDGITNFIIPIKAAWAAQLFDTGMAEAELFGVFARLALNRENVYYRSSRPAGFVLPARIIWYVCRDDDVTGSMALRACSRMLSFEAGPAKQLFTRHQRIGIYQWRDILKTAGNNPFAPIMAIRFADSEPFRNPVPVEFVRQLGIASQFQSPTQITEEQFVSIYKKGMAPRFA